MSLKMVVGKFGPGPCVDRPASLFNQVINPIRLGDEVVAHKQHVLQQMRQSGAICRVKEMASLTANRHAAGVYFRFMNNEYPESIFENK